LLEESKKETSMRVTYNIPESAREEVNIAMHKEKKMQ
jgi:hypothetical protein